MLVIPLFGRLFCFLARRPCCGVKLFSLSRSSVGLPVCSRGSSPLVVSCPVRHVRRSLPSSLAGGVAVHHGDRRADHRRRPHSDHLLLLRRVGQGAGRPIQLHAVRCTHRQTHAHSRGGRTPRPDKLAARSSLVRRASKRRSASSSAAAHSSSAASQSGRCQTHSNFCLTCAHSLCVSPFLSSCSSELLRDPCAEAAVPTITPFSSEADIQRVCKVANAKYIADRKAALHHE